MKPIHVILLAGCLTVFFLDALSSIASRRYNFNYARVAPISVIIYIVIGFAGAGYTNQVTGIILAAAVGFFDATIGWKTAIVLRANTGKLDDNPSISRWISTAIVVTFLAAICGVVGSELLRWIR